MPQVCCTGFPSKAGRDALAKGRERRGQGHWDGSSYLKGCGLRSHPQLQGFLRLCAGVESSYIV